MAVIYKSVDNSVVENRNITSTDSTTTQKVKDTLSQFIVYFKAKHL
jgi:hypothetical protein